MRPDVRAPRWLDSAAQFRSMISETLTISGIHAATEWSPRVLGVISRYSGRGCAAQEDPRNHGGGAARRTISLRLLCFTRRSRSKYPKSWPFPGPQWRPHGPPDYWESLSAIRAENRTDREVARNPRRNAARCKRSPIPRPPSKNREVLPRISALLSRWRNIYSSLFHFALD